MNSGYFHVCDAPDHLETCKWYAGEYVIERASLEVEEQLCVQCPEIVFGDCFAEELVGEVTIAARRLSIASRHGKEDVFTQTPSTVRTR